MSVSTSTGAATAPSTATAPPAASDLAERIPWSPLLWAVWLAATVLGTVGVVMRVAEGHLPAGYGSYVPWGLWVAFYFHGVGIAGGAFVLGGLGFLLDWPGFRRREVLRAVIVLSAAAIIPAFFAVWVDLGRLDRSHLIFTSPAFTSMMAFNAWMYAGFAVVAAICWGLSFQRTSPHLKPLLCLAILLSVLFPSQSGAFFGVVDAKPHWHSALLPMVFLASAVTAGAAGLLAVRLIMDRDRRHCETDAAVSLLRWVTLAGLAIYFVFEFAEFSIALWSPYNHQPAVDLILFGPYWWMFWIVHLLLGGLVPAVLLCLHSRFAWLAASVLVAVAFVSARLNVLVPGQAVGELAGLQEAFQHPRLSYLYHPTPMEYLVGFFVLAMGMSIFYIGQRLGYAVADRLPSDP